MLYSQNSPNRNCTRTAKLRADFPAGSLIGARQRRDDFYEPYIHAAGNFPGCPFMADPPPPFPGKIFSRSLPFLLPIHLPVCTPGQPPPPPPATLPLLVHSPPLLLFSFFLFFPFLLHPSSSQRQRMQGLSRFAPLPHITLPPSPLSSLLCIPSFFAFVSPDPVHSFSTCNSTVFLHFCSSPPFPLDPPPECLGSSQAEISISFEFNIRKISSSLREV